MYSDEALAELKDICNSCDMDCHTSQCDTKKVSIIVDPDGLNLTAWFDVNKQLFGFDMLHGGCKTYDNPSDFKQFFKLYSYVNIEFLPIAKRVADDFEAVVGVNSVYDTFKGNSNSGYKALFKILSKTDERIIVFQKDGAYVAQHICYTDDSHFEVLKTYRYELDGASEEHILTRLPSYDAFEDALVDYYSNLDGCSSRVLNDGTYEFRYANREGVAFKRVAVDTFIFSINTIKAEFKISISYVNVFCKVVKVNNLDCNIELEMNIFEKCTLDDMYLECVGFLSDNGEDEVNESEKETQEEDEAVSDEALSDGVDDGAIDKGVVETADEVVEAENNESIPDSASENAGTSSDEAKMANTEEKLEDTDEVSKSSNDFTIKIGKSEENELLFVQFVVNECSIYNINAQKAIELGIPINRLTDKVEIIKKKGISLSGDEKRLHKFAQDISDDDELCHQMIDLLFE